VPPPLYVILSTAFRKAEVESTFKRICTRAAESNVMTPAERFADSLKRRAECGVCTYRLHGNNTQMSVVCELTGYMVTTHR
jgi:hypothetical protein